jgi:Predicted ABC-type transport system involved in lysophospholipase L1 biosynthesis, permease component
MARIGKVAPLLLRGRVSAGHGVVDLLAIAAFTLSSWLLLIVLAGVNAFYQRQLVPPEPFVRALGADAAVGVSQLVFWTWLAVCAGVLLIVPVMSLGAGAARMGALGRDQRLSTLRLLGVTGGQAVALSSLETMLSALLGAAAGTIGYLVTLPGWALLRFEAAPLTAAEMLLPPLAIAGVIGVQVVLAGLSSATGLLRLRISPLGVARREPRPGLKVWRFLAVPGAVVAWVVVAPLLSFSRDLTMAASIAMIALAIFMGVINLVGPWLLQLIGAVLARVGGPSLLIAGRRLLADPKGSWRSVSGLAFVGFTGGALMSVPGANDPDPLTAILTADIQTGTYLTVAIAFLVAAASTLLNQASAVLDRRQELRQLSNLGVPLGLHARVRLVAVVVPAALAAFGAGGLAAFFFALMPKLGTNDIGYASFCLAMAAGIALVWAAGESCRPLVRAAASGLEPDGAPQPAIL